MSQMSIQPKDLVSEISEPFFWPLSIYIKKSGLNGIEDYLSSDKRLVKMFCTQLIFIYLHGITAVLGFLIIAYSIMK